MQSELKIAISLVVGSSSFLGAAAPLHSSASASEGGVIIVNRNAERFAWRLHHGPMFCFPFGSSARASIAERFGSSRVAECGRDGRAIWHMDGCLVVISSERDSSKHTKGEL